MTTPVVLSVCENASPFHFLQWYIMKTANKSTAWTFFTKSSSDEVKTSENENLKIYIETLKVNKSLNES